MVEVAQEVKLFGINANSLQRTQDLLDLSVLPDGSASKASEAAWSRRQAAILSGGVGEEGGGQEVPGIDANSLHRRKAWCSMPPDGCASVVLSGGGGVEEGGGQEVLGIEAYSLH